MESPETAVQNTSISVNLLEFDDVAYRLQVGNCGEAQVVATVITFGLERLLLQVWAPNVRLRCAFRVRFWPDTGCRWVFILRNISWYGP